MDERIYDEHYEAVFKYILYITNDAQLTHDLLQETFFRFFKQRRSVENPKAFLLKIARNIIYDHFRKKRLITFFTLGKEERVDDAPLPPEIIERGEEIEQLYKSLQQLKLSYKETIILRYIEEYSVKETAVILGQSETQVKNNTARGLQALRKLMEGGVENGRATIKATTNDSSK